MVKLSDRDRGFLDGIHGAATQMAMSTMVPMAKIHGDDCALHPVHQIRFKQSIADH